MLICFGIGGVGVGGDECGECGVGEKFFGNYGRGFFFSIVDNLVLNVIVLYLV